MAPSCGSVSSSGSGGSSSLRPRQILPALMGVVIGSMSTLLLVQLHVLTASAPATPPALRGLLSSTWVAGRSGGGGGSGGGSGSGVRIGADSGIRTDCSSSTSRGARAISDGLWPPYAAAAGGEPASVPALPLCVPSVLSGLVPTAADGEELGAALDCLCFPRVVRPAHCRTLVLQSGDYAVGARTYSEGIAGMPFHTASRTAQQLYAAAHGYSYLYVDVRERSVALDRASAWMKLPLLRLVLRYFDAVFVVDPDVVPGLNFTTPLRALTELLAAGSGKVAVMAGNAPSPAGGPCTGAMLFRSAPGGSDDTERLLQHWWSAPEREPEFAATKTKHVWEQQVIDTYIRRKGERASSLVAVLPPPLMGNPDSPFMQHVWSDGSGSNAERSRKVQYGLLRALASAAASCDARPRCAELIARFARWDNYRPVVPWALLHAGGIDEQFWKVEGEG